MCKIYISTFEQTEKQKHQTEHLAGLCLLSHALFDYDNLSISASELTDEIETGTHGKPYLKSYPNLHYNISHSNNLVVCAISNAPIGVDIEEITSFPESILRRTLTDNEKAFLAQMSIDDASHQEWFFRFWTLKESHIKHSGKGLSMPLTDFSFTFQTDVHPFEISCSDEGLFFHQELLRDNYVLSVCVSDPNARPLIIWV